MSSSVCNPLKRAKSTVGSPLTSDTLFPLLSIASTLMICTEKEVTLASGASVPTTKAGPVTVFGFVVVVVVGLVPLQPTAMNVATGNETRAVRSLRWIENDIIESLRFLRCPAANRERTLSWQTVPLPWDAAKTKDLQAPAKCGYRQGFSVADSTM